MPRDMIPLRPIEGATVLPHSIKGWVRLMDVVSPAWLAMGDAWKDTFFVPAERELDLYPDVDPVWSGPFLSDAELSADDADWDGYSSQWRRK